MGGTFVDKHSIATVPDTQTAQFEYDNLLMSWGNREWGTLPDGPAGDGCYIYGDKGTLRLGSPTTRSSPFGGRERT